MSRIVLSSAISLNHSRYLITLSTEKELVLFRLPKIGASEAKQSEWSYYCMEAECPHAGGPMSDASVRYDMEDSNYIASCPWHSYDFNLKTGESQYNVTACTYPIEVQDELLILIHPHESVSLHQISPVSEEFKMIASPVDTPNAVKPVQDTAQVQSLVADLDSYSKDSHSDNSTICEWCVRILNTADPELKITLTHQLFNLFTARETSNQPLPIGAGLTSPPREPCRTALKVVGPGNMPKLGRGGNVRSRVAMLHSLANIEQWAIDLALDICVRFASFETKSSSPRRLPRTFFADWIKVANDEAKHFSLLRARIVELGASFGDLPVHHGLWESADLTAHDLRARISIIALVHEARGLDVNPMTIQKFRNSGDFESVESLLTIHRDEITHVTTGHRWLTWICEQESTDPVTVFRDNVKKYFKGSVKGPFNDEARTEAGLDERYYSQLEGRPKTVLIAGG